MTSRGFFPTTNHNKAFIARVWGMRGELEESEKRGLYQFLYLTICEHVESLLSSIIKARLNSINRFIVRNDIPPINYIENGVASLQDLKVVVESILKIVKWLENEAESSPLNSLIGLHNKIFQKKLNELISKERNQDLMALASLRNLFAHGRNLFIDFELDDSDSEIGIDFDLNPLKPAFDRLRAAGIVKEISSFNFENYHDLIAIFYSDNACLYFYKAVQKIEEELMKSIEFLPEKAGRFFVPLPDLEAQPED